MAELDHFDIRRNPAGELLRLLYSHHRGAGPGVDRRVFAIGAGVIAGFSLAGWPGPGTPTAAQCEDLLRTQPVSSLEDHTGLIFCAKGLGVLSPHVGFGQVVSYDGNVSQINVTVWSATLKN